MKKKDIFSVKNKVAIVTGAAKGNGFAMAEGLARAGAIVYFVDILRCNLPSGKTFQIKADITKEKDIKNLLRKVISSQKRVDILVNNAGIARPVPSEECSPKDWDSTVNTNLKAQFFVSQAVAREMIKSKNGGSIINITSLYTRFGSSGNPAYVASKSGLNGLTRALAKDWAKYNIRVNNICPGYIHTDMTRKSYNDPLLYKERIDRAMIKRYGEPKDLVGGVIFLASNASAYVTGIDLFIDGGWSVNGI